MWKNTVQPGGAQVTRWRIRIICLVPKATNAHKNM